MYICLVVNIYVLGYFFGYVLKLRILFVYFVILIFVYFCKMVLRFKKLIDGFILIKKKNGFLNIVLKMCLYWVDWVYYF